MEIVAFTLKQWTIAKFLHKSNKKIAILTMEENENTIDKTLTIIILEIKKLKKNLRLCLCEEIKGK